MNRDETLHELGVELNKIHSDDSQALDDALAKSGKFVDYENAWTGVLTWNGRSYNDWEAAFRRLGKFLVEDFTCFWLPGIRDDAIADGDSRKAMSARLLELACQPDTAGQIAEFLRDKITGPTTTRTDVSCWQGLLAIRDELSQKTELPPIPARSKNDLAKYLKGWKKPKEGTIRKMNWVKSDDTGTKAFRHSDDKEHKSALMFLGGHVGK